MLENDFPYGSHITAIWTPLTRKRGCGVVVSATCESPYKDSRSRAWVRIPRAALFRKPP